MTFDKFLDLVCQLPHVGPPTPRELHDILIAYHPSIYTATVEIGPTYIDVTVYSDCPEPLEAYEETVKNCAMVYQGVFVTVERVPLWVDQDQGKNR